MIKQTALGPTAEKQKEKIRQLIKRGAITLAGNYKLKIYGKLTCNSGKRLNAENRVFFKDESEALNFGYRPCGNCMPKRYQNWKINLMFARDR